MVNSPPNSQISTFRLRRRTQGTFVLVPCPKQGRSIRCQGQLEAATAQILAACPLVTEIQEQPLAIWYAYDELTTEITLLDDPPTKAFRKSHRTSYVVPDFLVTMNSGARRLVEVKPAAKLDRPLVQRKLSVARLAAERLGWSYHVLTERRLFAGSLLKNVRLLNRFRQLPVDQRRLDGIYALMAQAPMTIQTLASQMDANDIVAQRGIVLHFIAVGRLALDLNAAPISPQSSVYLGENLWDPFDSVWGPSGSATNGCFASSANSVAISTSPKT